MKRTRRKFSASFKAKVVLEALKERKSLSELAESFHLHPNQISQWKKEFLSNAEQAFGGSDSRSELTSLKEERDSLYQQIGKLSMENEWLKKKVVR